MSVRRDIQLGCVWFDDRDDWLAISTDNTTAWLMQQHWCKNVGYSTPLPGFQLRHS
uniref:Uncharacterized protein n=1 Tax=Triticum urartu TaxID=4572 RepID=A0A8R7P4F3_TRIUA